VTSRRAPRIVSVDTNVLIWGIRKQGPPDKRTHAGYLFRQLDADRDERGENNVQIIIPTIVLAEFITPVRSREERERVIGELGKRFLIEPFDEQDAALAATLWHFGKGSRQKHSPPRDGQRVVLRADTMIVATARGHGATEFFSDDEGARAMAAEAGMIAKKLPTIAPSLYEQDDATTRPDARGRAPGAPPLPDKG
jgi:predicted nucleic acid-binding protein